MTDTKNLITDNIDIWTSALQTKSGIGRGSSKKLNLYGIKKLRELILELAVRGKLVPQVANDEPASKLLERIAEEKEVLVKEKKIKKSKDLPEIGAYEKPFVLPAGWSFIRLEKITKLITKGSSPKWQGVAYTENPQDVLFVTSENVGAFNLLLNKKKYVELKFNEIEPRSILNRGDLLMNIVGASIGRTAIYDIEILANINQAVCLIRSFPEQLNNQYLLDFFNSSICISYMYDKQVENARPNLSMTNIAKFIIPLPPLPEQKRIVAKVDELMALCDQLESQTEFSIVAHETLVETLLSTLSESKNNEELSGNWARIATHFETLFFTESSIDKLKQTVLQLAVMGKLVEQDENDEPASVLLEKIAEEKARLVKEGKNKKQKDLPEISEEEKVFDLPKGWEWVRLLDISLKITDGDHKTPPRIQEGYRLLSAKNVRDGFLYYENCDYIAEEHYLKSRERCLPEIGDLLIVSVGGTIGRSSLIKKDSKFALVRSVALIKPLHFSSEYLKLTMDSNLLQNTIHEKKRGGAQPCLYLSEISCFPFPLPPLSEQYRIVTKVNQLTTLCNQLKERIHVSKNIQKNFADVVVQQVVG